MATNHLRLMAVHAHPDDESSKGAATLSYYLDQGVEVLVATCTGGERGSILNPAMDRPDVLANMAEIRLQEMARAQEIIGFQHAWLGFVDSGYPEGGYHADTVLPAGSFASLPLSEAAEPLVRLVREFKPHVIATYDETGGYPHPDHVMCHRVSMEAFEAAGDPERYPAAGPSWQPLKLYYQMSLTPRRIWALHNAMMKRDLPSPFAEWLSQLPAEDQVPDRVTTRIPCAEFYPIRNQALLAHATQIDPEGSWFAIPPEVELEIAATDDYELARSLVDSDLPEDDLFAGVRERIDAC